MQAADIVLDELVKITGTEEVRTEFGHGVIRREYPGFAGSRGINCGSWRGSQYQHYAGPGGPKDVGNAGENHRGY